MSGIRSFLSGALLALTALVLPAAAQEPVIEVKLYYPPDKTLVERAEIPVEGVVRTGGVDEVDIVVNAGRPRRAFVRDGLFAEEIELEEGLNTIRVGNAQAGVWLAGGKAAPPRGFEKAYGHFGLDDGCLECHEVGEGGALTLAAEREELCGWCHGDLARGKAGVAWVSVHAPVRGGKCLDCHSPHLSTKRGLPAESAPTCQSCHPAVTERLGTDRFVHGPMNLGDCRLCHAVHSSGEPRLLVRPATALCVDCHSDAIPPPGTAAALQPHPMIPEGQCGRCHEPHSSMNQRMLREPAGRLCQGCHEGKTRSFHEAKGFSIYVCAKCHDLHRPTQPHLIIDASRSLCTECHEFRAEAAFTHSFVREGRCFLCHTFHEESLGGDVAAICLPCHRDNPRLGAAHRGIAIGKARCTLCHLPHQSRRPKLLLAEEHTPFAQRECDPCHRERADLVGPSYRPLCVSCHRELDLAAQAAAPAELHPPFRDQDCSGCHRSHAAEAPNLLREPEGKFCLDCHRKMRKAALIAPVSAHEAVTEGRCGACHDPHFSPNAALLRKPQAALCASCHAALLQGPGGKPWERPHKPVAEGKCRLCHRPHTSTNPSLLKAPSPQACRPCHTEFFSSIEGGARSRHAPVTEGRCGACHGIHGSDVAVLLRGAAASLCGGCHREMKGMHHTYTAAELDAKSGRKGAAERGCLQCHNPHASSNRRLLLRIEDPACAGCHKI